MTRPGARATLAVFERPGEPLHLAEVERPAPGPGEALVAVRCCTICGSDLHTVRGARPVHGPTCLGHEIVGVIEAIGAGGVRDLGGRELAAGDRVTWSLVVPCGQCRGCARGRPAHCADRFKYGHAAVGGPTALTGGLASHCLLVAGTAIAKVPPTLSDEVAATASCAGATVCAALEALGPIEGDHVAITGAGLLGVTAVAFARARGAARISVVDRDPNRLELARRFGADDVFVAEGPGSERPPLADVDAALELSGAPQAFDALLGGLGVGGLGVGGRMVLAGAVFPGPAVRIQPEDLIRRRIRLTGLHNYEPHHLGMALDALATSTAPFAEVIEGPVPLADVQQAIETALSGAFLRIAVSP